MPILEELALGVAMADELFSQVRSEDAAKIALGVARLNAAETLEELSLELMQLCDELVDTEHVCYTELDPYFGRTIQWSTSPEYDADVKGRWETWHEVMLTQPLILHYMSNPGDRPRRMSDVVGDAGLRKTPFWSEIMQPLGVDRQLVLHLGLDPVAGGVTAPMMAGLNFNRKAGEFSDEWSSPLKVVHQLG